MNLNYIFIILFFQFISFSSISDTRNKCSIELSQIKKFTNNDILKYSRVFKVKGKKIQNGFSLISNEDSDVYLSKDFLEAITKEVESFSDFEMFAYSYYSKDRESLKDHLELFKESNPFSPYDLGITSNRINRGGGRDHFISDANNNKISIKGSGLNPHFSSAKNLNFIKFGDYRRNGLLRLDESIIE